MESVSWSPDWAAREQQTLAPYAMRTSASRGRKYPDQGHPYRSLYQRDRDRIVYSTAFRRLMYKTQVLVNQTNDHHRTRLTHTLEVASISRTIARQLAVNEDLTEAIALAHDLGHPPFGHAGEDALNECMKHHGGFEHNWHGLRILDHLEHRYAEHPGLNLSFEILEAQAYHSKRRDLPEIQTYVSNGQPLLEAQIVDASDSLAYDTHDIDDALTVQLIQFGDLQGVEFWRRAEQRVRERYTSMEAEDFQAAMMRMLIDWQVTDLLAATRRRLSEHDIRSVEQVRGANDVLVRPGDEVLTWKAELERFLHAHVYRHHRVMRMAAKGSRFLREMFAEYCRCPEQLPARYYQRTLTGLRERTVCDYLAGMTDRYAQDEYLRLFQPYTSV